MDLKPLFDRVVVRRVEEGEQQKGGIIIPDSAKEKPQRGEVVAVGQGKRLDDGKLAPLDIKAGDLVLTHSGLLHSRTQNTSGSKRYFFSVYYNISWLKYTDTFDGPNCRQLIAWARSRNDHRALRLLGQDDHLQARGNSGFQEPDEGRWAEWSAADRDAITELDA